MTQVIKANLSGEGSPQAVVLKLADIAEEARRVVLDARKQAAQIVAQAQQGVQAAQREAAERGYAEGFARGRDDGYSDGLKRASEEDARKFADESARYVALLKEIVAELSGARGRMLQEIRGHMLEFAIYLAGKIVGRVAARDISAAEANLQKALALATFDGEILVKVNPCQLQPLRQRCAGLSESLAIAGGVRMVGDESVSPGGVKLVCRNGEIDATVETQMNKVVQTLLGSDRPGGQGCYRPGLLGQQSSETQNEPV